MKRRIMRMTAVLMTAILMFSNMILVNADAISTEDYIIVLDSAKMNTALVEQYGIDLQTDALSNLTEDVLVVESELTDKQFVRLQKEKAVVAIDKETIMYGCDTRGAEDQINLEQWYLEAINVNGNESVNKEIKVGVLDSGVSYSESMHGVEWYNLIDNADNVLFDDVRGHGTAIAGLIASDGSNGLKGINPKARILSVKVLDEQLETPVSRVVEGIYLCIEKEVDIINMSFGTNVDSELLRQAVKDAEEAGILMIAASGNTGEHGVMYPAAYDEVIAVGATDADGTVADYTSFGPELELLAPGEAIAVTGLFDGLTAMDGTSIAAAEVSGVASVIMAKEGATSSIVRSLLKESAKDINGTDGKLIDCAYALLHYDEFVENYAEPVAPTLENTMTVQTFEVDNTMVGQWAKGAHSWLVEESSEGNITNATYISIMSLTAQVADSVYKGDNYKGLHGFGNYFINAKALWKYANYMKQGYSAIQSRSKVESLFSSVNFGAASEQTYYMRMLNATEEMLTNCPNATVKSYANSGNNAYKKYLVVGFLMHMLGDTYAHRTLVPDYVVVNAKSKRYASGNSSDFASYLGKSEFNDWNDFVAERAKNGVTFENLDRYMKKLNEINSLYSNSSYHVDSIGKIYVDNADFCRERVNASLKSCKYLAGKIGVSGQTFSSDVIKQQTNVNLINFDKYLEYLNK